MLIELSNQECLSGSFNGPSLMETLRSLSPGEAASSKTYEGYSAWGVALHVLYFKQLVGTELGAEIPDYTYEKADFPKLTDEVTQETWDKLLSDLEATHRGFIDAFAAVSEEALEAEHAAWKIPLRKSVAWVICHDTSHNAQIRSMGLPSLKKPVKG